MGDMMEEKLDVRMSWDMFKKLYPDLYANKDHAVTVRVGEMDKIIDSAIMGGANETVKIMAGMYHTAKKKSFWRGWWVGYACGVAAAVISVAIQAMR